MKVNFILVSLISYVKIGQFYGKFLYKFALY